MLASIEFQENRDQWEILSARSAACASTPRTGPPSSSALSITAPAGCASTSSGRRGYRSAPSAGTTYPSPTWPRTKASPAFCRSSKARRRPWSPKTQVWWARRNFLTGPTKKLRNITTKMWWKRWWATGKIRPKDKLESANTKDNFRPRSISPPFQTWQNWIWVLLT